ncbi:MAG: DNA polymerase III subunit epsilon [Alphaproteobacteria bacterium]|nr:DNA polymerase III subunit epsilon [Alphaproteobacteria bacterium]
MREIVLDTETTGLDPAAGHRVVEIACIELVNRIPTGKSYQTYLNPERDMPEEAFKVHGLSQDFLAGHKTFAEEADRFLDFIGDAGFVIHNAEFDLRFLNWELRNIGRDNLGSHPVVDTVLVARKKFPGAPASLDALCRRFGIDNSARTVHGALLDAELLADVYLELMGGRQTALGFAAGAGGTAAAATRERESRAPRPHGAAADELAAHAAFIARIKDPIWNA